MNPLDFRNLNISVEDLVIMFPQDSEISVAHCKREWHVGVCLPSGRHLFGSGRTLIGAIWKVLGERAKVPSLLN